MTVVVAFKNKNKAVMLSDSRATGSVVADKLQKILPLGKNAALGYSGNVSLAGKIFEKAKNMAKAKPPLTIWDFQKIAIGEYKITQNSVTFIMGVNLPAKNNVFLYKFSSPKFDPIEIKQGLEVVGSGSVIKKYLEEKVDEFETNDIKEMADKLFTKTSSLLGKYVWDDTVGGMLQIVTIEPSGIKPFKYGFVDVDPDLPPISKGIEMQKGHWKQFDYVEKQETELLEPTELIKTVPVNSRFHDFHPPKDYSAEKWHLLHFITCLQAQYQPGLMEFTGITTLFGKNEYPIEVGILSCIGFWGSPGRHKISFWLINGVKKELLHDEEIEIEYLPKIIDLAIPLKFYIESPGQRVLECKIDSFTLGRKPLLFHKINLIPDETDNLASFSSKVNKEMLRVASSTNDEEMEKDGKPELVYFALCEKYQYENSHLKLENQFLSIYWNKYPLPYKTQIVSGFRMPKGKHKIKIELVDAISREAKLIDTATVISKSSFLVTPIVGNSGILIPKPSIYFVNILIDDKRIGTFIFSAETAEAQYSYSLLPDIEERVKKGELFSLVRGAPNT